jgi:hypothetical protein
MGMESSSRKQIGEIHGGEELMIGEINHASRRIIDIQTRNHGQFAGGFAVFGVFSWYRCSSLIGYVGRY